MGLDSYIRYDRIASEDIVGWRKHYAMHNWFAKKAIQLGIVENGEEFNCVNVNITQEILDQLISDVKEDKLNCPTGLFFSRARDPNEDMEADLEDLKKVQEALNNGKEPYYWSWW